MEMSARTARRTLCCLAIGLVVAFWSPRAWSFSVEVHKDFYDLAFPNDPRGERNIAAASASDLASFRHFIFDLARADPNFHQRWPSSADFNAFAFKEFLSLNPLRRVVGIDFVPADRATDLRTVVREGSTDPDNDRRNQDRLHLLPDGSVSLDSSGRAVPADPRTVWFGGLVGPGSQFDAHGATLRHGSKGKWLITTLGRPQQYARPKVTLGSAPEFSECYAQLAMIAALWGGSGSEWLALTFAGNSLHGIEDMGNQIHATQIGSHRFYLDTLKAYIATRFRPLKDSAEEDASRFHPPERLTVDALNEALELLETPDSMNPQVRFALGLEPKGNLTATAIATRILGSHHRLLEAYVQERYLQSRDLIQAGASERAEPAVVALIAQAKAGDSDFREHSLSVLAEAGLGNAAKGSTPFAQILAEEMLERSAPEAAPLYESIRSISIAPLRQARQVYFDGQPTTEYIQPKYAGENSDNKYTRRIWKFSGASFARVVTAIRIWFEAFELETGGVVPGSPEAIDRAQLVARRLASDRMELIQAAAKRRTAYLSEKREN